MNSKKSSSEDRLLISYLQLRSNIGRLGLALPIALIVVGRLRFGLEIQSSISAYYHTGMRDVFVGLLCAIGVFLYSYKGHNWQDNWVANIAGLSAVMVAWFPTDSPGSPGPLSLIAWVHFISAAVFFGSLAYFSGKLFVKTNKTKIKVKGAKKTPKEKRNEVYLASAWTIIAAMVLLLVFNGLPEAARISLAPLDPVFWLETLAIFAFSFSWLVKGQVFWKDRREADNIPPKSAVSVQQSLSR